jgi:hypothetical protein
VLVLGIGFEGQDLILVWFVKSIYTYAVGTQGQVISQHFLMAHEEPLLVDLNSLICLDFKFEFLRLLNYIFLDKNIQKYISTEIVVQLKALI